MKSHTKIYLRAFGYNEFDETEYKPCEICGNPLVDVHHIEQRGMGGSKKKDNIENLMGLCRLCHVTYGDITKYLDMLKKIHTKFIERHGS